MKKKKKDEEKIHQVLSSIDAVCIRGGRLWPFFDLQKIISKIRFGDDFQYTSQI